MMPTNQASHRRPARRLSGGQGLAVLGFLIASAAEAQSAGQPAQKLRVAVMDLSGSALRMQSTTVGMPPPPQPYGQPPGEQTTITIAIPPPAEFARGLTEILTSVLVKTGRFSVLERAAMQQIDAEQALGAGGKATKETAAAPGALLGAQALITGDITGFSFEKSSLGGKLTNVVKGLTVASERVSAEVIIDLRLIDATTGEIIHSAKGTGSASQVGVAADLVKDEKKYSADAAFTTPLGQASRQAIQSAVVSILMGMPKIRWYGRVIDEREGVVYVNATAADGMRAGLELEVFEAQPALVDPETGKSLGAPERLVATIVIETTLEKVSTAKLVSGTGVARGHIVRLKAQ
jgi:curli biogenesis system outer membrane secretion channel CsgG